MQFFYTDEPDEEELESLKSEIQFNYVYRYLCFWCNFILSI